MHATLNHRILDTAQMEAMTGYDQRTLRERHCAGNGMGLTLGRHFTRAPGGRKLLFDWTTIAADMGLPDDRQEPGDLLRTEDMARLIRYSPRTVRERLLDRLFTKGTHYFLFPAAHARTLLFLKSAVTAAVGIGGEAVEFPGTKEPGIAQQRTEKDERDPVLGAESGGGASGCMVTAFTPSATDFWAQAARAFLDDLPAHTRHAARVEITTAVDRDLSPYFAQRTVTEITLVDVTVALENIAAERGRPFASMCFRLLHEIFARATQLWGVPSPIKHLERLPYPEKLPRVLRVHEVQRVIGLAPAHYRAYFIVRLFTGISNDEAHSLRGRAILLDTGEIRIDEIRVGDAWVPLDDSRTRTIKMSRIVKEALISHRAATALRNENDLVFADASGHPLKTASLTQKVFEPLLHAAGLRPMQLRELSHTAPFLWLCANHSPHEVAEWCGYGGDAAEVLRRYQRLAFTGEGYANVDRLLAAATSDEGRLQLSMPLALPLAA
jgi:hypothetical protein